MPEHLGIMALIGACAAGLAVLTVSGLLLVTAQIDHPRCLATVTFYPNGRTGEARGKTINARRGRCRLSEFKLGDLGGGLIASKCYLQMTRNGNAILHTNIKILHGRLETKDIVLPDGVEVELRMWRGLDEVRDADRLLTVKFETHINPRPSRRRRYSQRT